MNEKIISKIQKLLALSKSTNEEEANLAFAKAKSLALNHDLDLEIAAIQGIDTEEKQPFGEEEIFNGKIPVINKYVIHIIQDFFKVRAVYFTANRKTRITFFGRMNDIEIAKEVYCKLIQTFDWLWKNYKAKHNYKNNVKASYLFGLKSGLVAKLTQEKQNTFKNKILELPNEIRESTEKSLSLAIVNEEQLLEKKKSLFYGKLGKKRSSYINITRGDVYSDGVRDGQSINTNVNQKTLGG